MNLASKSTTSLIVHMELCVEVEDWDLRNLSYIGLLYALMFPCPTCFSFCSVVPQRETVSPRETLRHSLGGCGSHQPIRAS